MGIGATVVPLEAPTVEERPIGLLVDNQAPSYKGEEDIYLIWAGSIPASYTKTTLKSQLRAASSAVIFVALQTCVAQCKSSNKGKLFVILNSTFNAAMGEIITELNTLRQVNVVFVIDPDDERVKKYRNLLTDLTKLTHFPSFDSTMLNYICKLIRTTVKMAVDFNMFDQDKQSTIRDLTRNAAAFLWFQVLLYVLKDMGQDKHAHNEMIKMCQRYYEKHNDQAELNNIAVFRETYKKGDAINWYTRECFLYKLLNKALRTEDVHSLCTFRTFIVHLCNQIDNLHKTRKDSGDNTIMTLYRGQLMEKREHYQMLANKNKLISTNGFISTTLIRNEAIQFALDKAQQSDLIPVLFEIKASPDLQCTKFADISALSAFPDEKEILFNLGAAFQIDDIKELSGSDSYTVVQMTATDKGHDTVNSYIELSKNDLEDDDKKVMFGRLLINMGQYQESKIYFGGFIDSMRNAGRDDSLECAAFFHNQGRAHACMGEFEEAIKLMTRALGIRQKHLKLDDPRVAHTLNSIGVIEGEMGRYANAKTKFVEALNIFQGQNASESGSTASLHIATTKSNIGWVNYLQGNYEESLQNQNEVLGIRRKLLTPDHPLIADNLHALGALHHAQGQYPQAQSKYDEALTMREKTLPSHHPAIANSYQSLGSVELENGQYKQALKYYKKAYDIFYDALGPDHLVIASSYKAIGNVYLEKGDHRTALQHYTMALQISVKSLSEDHPTAGECHLYIGLAFERQGKYKEAINEYEKALEYIQNALPIDHPSIAKIFSSLANAHILVNKLPLAEHYLLRAHDIQKKIYSNYHPDLVLTLNNMGVLYTHKNDQTSALRYFNEALQMCKQCFPKDHPAVGRTKFNIGELYSRNNNNANALLNYKEALEIRVKVLPADDLSLADTHSQIACIYFRQKQYAEAKQHWLKSRHIYSNNGYNAEQADVKRVNNNLSILSTVINENVTQ
ncbi:unnamed protein product [Rotaria magnacalcarata]